MKSRAAKRRANSLVTTQKIVAGEHLNPNGVLFGGYLMCWMDEIAYMCARRYSGKPSCVTVNIDNITFRTPIKLGEHIHLSAWVNHAGKTSMEIEVKVERDDPRSEKRTHTNSAYLTFVCLNKNFQPSPVPELILESLEDQRKNQEARIRARVRKRLVRYLGKKFEASEKPPRIRDEAAGKEAPFLRGIVPLRKSARAVGGWIREHLSHGKDVS